ncbi:MAG TPA: SRPBCC family protein [Fontimonas sp.]
MALQQIQNHATVHAPVDAVFAFFADHEKFVTLLGARCRRVKDGEDDPNGLGSVRRFASGPLAFEETIVTFKRNQQIEYAITRGSPVKNHRGTINFKSVDGATVIDYSIRLEGKLPLIGPIVAAALRLAWKLNSPKVLANLEAGKA